MTQIASLPKTTTLWVKSLTQTFKLVDDALSTTVVHQEKCQLICSEMSRFLEFLMQRAETKLIPREICRLFEFVKATAAFVGLLALYQPQTWLVGFLNNRLTMAFEDLSTLWTSWSDASDVFCFPCFGCLDALAFCHSKDLIAVYSALSGQYHRFSAFPQLRNSVNARLSEIKTVLQTPNCEPRDESNSAILKSSDWEVTKPAIGRGGYATVHLARLKATGEEIAVKELTNTMMSARHINYLKREIDSMCHLNHPNLLRLIGVTVTPPFCIATVYVSNGALYELIHKVGITGLHATQVALDVARGVEYLHAQGMIHRDLKPQNVLMDKNNRAIVCDFGLTRVSAPVMSCELGTVQWMAPEILKQGGKYDNTVDVYAYGVILYELGTKRFPYEVQRPMQTAAKVILGERLPLPDTICEPMRKLISRCWAQRPTDRPSMHQVVKELESGNVCFEGCNPNELRQWVKKTAHEHRDAMEALAKQQSNSQVLIARLKNLNPLDPLAKSTLQTILDRNVLEPSMMDDVIELAIQKSDEEVQKLALEVIEAMVKSNTVDPVEMYSSLLKMWEAQPGFVVSNLRTIAGKTENRHAFLRALLADNAQNARTVDAIEAIAERKDLAVIFELLDSSIVVQTLSFALSKFGPTEEMVPAVVSSFPALALMLRTVVKTEKYSAVYLDPSNAKEIEEAQTMLNTGYFMNSAEDLEKIIVALAPLLKKGGPGMATMDLLKTGAHYQKVARLISRMGFWELIAKSMDSNKEDICESALSLLSQLTVDEENMRLLWEPLVRCFTQTHSEIAFKVIQQFVKAIPGLCSTRLLYGLLTGLATPKAEVFLQMAFSVNLSSEDVVIDKTFWKLVAIEVPKLESQYVAALALMYLKYQKSCRRPIVSYDLVSAMLNFLYKQSAPFQLIIPVLQLLLNILSGLDIAIFLCHHNFIQYLHQLPLRYPKETKVAIILQQFMAEFESAANSVQEAGE